MLQVATKCCLLTAVIIGRWDVKVVKKFRLVVQLVIRVETKLRTWQQADT